MNPGTLIFGENSVTESSNPDLSFKLCADLTELNWKASRDNVYFMYH